MVWRTLRNVLFYVHFYEPEPEWNVSEMQLFIASTVGPSTHDYCTDSRFGPNHYSKIGMWRCHRCVAETMGQMTCIKRITLTLTLNLTPTLTLTLNLTLTINLPKFKPPFWNSGSVQICHAPSNWHSTLFQQCLASFSLPRSKFRRLSYKTDYAFVTQTNVAHSAIRQTL